MGVQGWGGRRACSRFSLCSEDSRDHPVQSAHCVQPRAAQNLCIKREHAARPAAHARTTGLTITQSPSTGRGSDALRANPPVYQRAED